MVNLVKIGVALAAQNAALNVEIARNREVIAAQGQAMDSLIHNLETKNQIIANLENELARLRAAQTAHVLAQARQSAELETAADWSGAAQIAARKLAARVGAE